MIKWIINISAIIFSIYVSDAFAQNNVDQQQQLQNLLQQAKDANQQQAQIQLPSTTAARQTQPRLPATSAIDQTTVTNTTIASNDESISAGGADNIRDEAFANMTQQQLPMTPNQIRTLRKLFDETQRAVAEYPGTPPKPTSSSIVVNLAPGATPPIIRLLAGFVTSLVFVDATGAPWPIHAYDLGDPNAFDIQWDKKSNTLLVQAISHYKSANLAVQLEGLNTPVMITLMPGQLAVDYRVDLHIPGLGPLATVTGIGLPSVESPELLNVLSGIPPSGSKQLIVTPEGYADVWLLSNRLYVRTRANVLSPAWVSTMSSSDGMHAYKMPMTPIMIVSLNGKPISLSVEGY